MIKIYIIIIISFLAPANKTIYTDKIHLNHIMNYREHAENLNLDYDATTAKILDERNEKESLYYPFIMKNYQFYIKSQLSAAIKFNISLQRIINALWISDNPVNRPAEMNIECFSNILHRDCDAINREVMACNEGLSITSFRRGIDTIYVFELLNPALARE